MGFKVKSTTKKQKPVKGKAPSKQAKECHTRIVEKMKEASDARMSFIRWGNNHVQCVG